MSKPLAKARERHVNLGSNHHMEIVAVLDSDGNETKWEGAVVTLYEACRRRQARQPVVCLDHGPGKRFKFSLAGGEVIELDEPDDSRALFVVRTISQEAPRDGAQSLQKVEFVRINDARQKKEIRDTGGWLTRSPNRLMELHCRKVQVDPLGEVHPAHD